MHYKEYFQFTAVVLVPHDPVLMAFYDLYSLEVPLFL